MPFQSTQWTLVGLAGTDSPQADGALKELCEAYWHPVNSFIRCKVQSDDDARDLTQEFFARLIEKKWLAAADRNRGKFRTFLLSCVQHFLLNEWHYNTAQKRGSGIKPLALESAYEQKTDGHSPERVFEKRWAMTVLERAISALQREHEQNNESAKFQAFRPYLTNDIDRVPYARLAGELGMSENSVKVAVHRLRQRYGHAIRNEIRETLHQDENLDEEIRYLLDVMGS